MIFRVEGFLIVVHVQMVSHHLAAVLFVHAGSLGGGVVEAFREEVLAAVGTGQVRQRRLLCRWAGVELADIVGSPLGLECDSQAVGCGLSQKAEGLVGNKLF